MGKRDQYQLVPEDDLQFARFWAAYPRRVAKKDARKAWAKLRPSPSMVDRMIATLEWQAAQPAWTKDHGAYIPYPASWLNAERWTDEPPQALQPRRQMSEAAAQVFSVLLGDDAA